MPSALTPLADIGTYEYDVRTRRAGWSEALYRIYGIDPDARVGGPELARELSHPADREALNAASAEVLERGVCEFEYRTIRPDGAVRRLFVRATLISDESGEPSRIVGFVIDVTKRRALAAAQV